MFTDIVGYTALMGEDEQQAFELLRKNRLLQKPIIEGNGGRWIKELGDGVMASFPTVTDAVNAAVAIQETSNRSKEFSLRIGIHQGEVVFEDGDVFGDGVNIASRLQALAPAGGIWVSEEVYKNVANKKDVRTRFIGEEKLKNVKGPVRIYQVETDNAGPAVNIQSQAAKSAASQIPKSGQQGKRRVIFAIASLIIISMVAWILYRQISSKKTQQIRTIAVMPFVNESKNADIEYLSDGITESLISSLSQLPDLNIKARSSVFRYKGKVTDMKVIGDELDVQALLLGRLVQRGDLLTLYTELIDANSENVLWSADFKQPMSSLLTLQSEVTYDVVEKLKLRLSEKDKENLKKSYSENSEAYKHYLKGRYFWNQRSAEGLKKAIGEFQKAIDIDPNYALAYSGLADAYVNLRGYTGDYGTNETLQKARAAAFKSLELDNSLAEAHASLGLVYYQEWKWADSERELKQSMDLNPRYASAYHWYSLWLYSMRRNKEALTTIFKARELDPFSPVINATVIRYYIPINIDSAIAEGWKTIELNPGFSLSYMILGVAYLEKNDYQNAMAVVRKAEKLIGGEFTSATIAYIKAKSGNKAEALSNVKDLEEKYIQNKTKAQTIAMVYTGLGDNHKALLWLEKAYQDGFLASHEVMGPIFKSLENDPRFKELKKRMGLPV